MSAMLPVLSVQVPCAYSTIGRGPEQAGAAPVGTISAPEDFGSLAGRADGPELDVIEIDAANRRARYLKQLRGGSVGRQLGTKACGVQGSYAQWRVFGQCAARG